MGFNNKKHQIKAFINLYKFNYLRFCTTDWPESVEIV